MYAETFIILENVRQNAFLRTFSKGKCSAVQKCICNILFCKNAFDATLTFCLQNVRKRQNAFYASQKQYCVIPKKFHIFSKA